jgi:streptogramin lyase
MERELVMNHSRHQNVPECAVAPVAECAQMCPNVPECSLSLQTVKRTHRVPDETVKRTHRRAHLTVFAALAFLLGCAGKPKPIFPPVNPAIQWPDAPEPARIRYIGQLATSNDLKRPVQGLEAIGGAIFGKKPAAAMLTPYAICTDGGDRIFVADSNAQSVHVFDMKTRRYARWLPAAPDRFTQPVGVTYDTALGRLYVSDSVGGTIHMFDRAGKYLGHTLPNLFKRPTGVCYDRRSKRLLVTDTAAHNVVVCGPNGEPITRFGERGDYIGQFNFPTSVAVDSSGLIYVCDALNFRVLQFAPDYQSIRQIGSKGDLPGYFGQPKAVACDSQGHVYVVDAQFEAVQIFDSEGRLLLNFGEEGHGPGQFWLPSGIFIDSQDRIWIADDYNRRLQVFQFVPEALAPQAQRTAK